MWVDKTGAETAIEIDRAFYFSPRFSPDGLQVATIRAGRHGLGDLWVMNVDGSQASPVADEGADYNPVWTPDGRTLTYTSNGAIYEKSVYLDESPKLLLGRDAPVFGGEGPESNRYLFPQSWSPDGEHLAFMEITWRVWRLWILSRDGSAEPLVDSAFNSGSARFSPRGDSIAYVTDESGRREVYVRSFPGSERGLPISRGGGEQPIWSPTGREVFYRRGDQMLAVEVATEPRLEVAEAVTLWQAPYFFQRGLWANYDVARDGRFLMMKMPSASASDRERMHVFLGWVADVAPRLDAAE